MLLSCPGPFPQEQQVREPDRAVQDPAGRPVLPAVPRPSQVRREDRAGRDGHKPRDQGHSTADDPAARYVKILQGV